VHHRRAGKVLGENTMTMCRFRTADADGIIDMVFSPNTFAGAGDAPGDAQLSHGTSVETEIGL